jgi:hypothetical protein
VVGAALAGERNFHLGDRLVRYHVHGHNFWFTPQPDPAAHQRVEAQRRELIAYLLGPCGLAQAGGADLTLTILCEFSTLPWPRWKDARRYVRLIRQSGGCWHLCRRLQVSGRCLAARGRDGAEPA